MVLDEVPVGAFDELRAVDFGERIAERTGGRVVRAGRDEEAEDAILAVADFDGAIGGDAHGIGHASRLIEDLECGALDQPPLNHLVERLPRKLAVEMVDADAVPRLDVLELAGDDTGQEAGEAR